MELLNDGTIELGYNDQPWTFSYDNADKYTFSAKPVRRKLLRFGEECFRAAREISKAANGRPVYVLYSGGIDSEAVLHAFVAQNLPVTAVCIKFDNDFNQHELKYAFEYFERMNFANVKMIDFDIRSWLKSDECRNLAREVQTVELGYTHLFKIALDHLSDGITITGHEEPLVWRVDDPATGASRWDFYCHERHYSIHKFFLKFKQLGVPSFFQWSTELLNSFIYNDHWVGLTNNMYSPLLWNTEQVKYGFMGKELQLPARKKYTSFEKLITEILDADREWKDSLPVKWERSCSFEVTDWLTRCQVR